MACSHKADVLVRSDYGIFKVCQQCAGVDAFPKPGATVASHIPGKVVRLASYTERTEPCQCEHASHGDASPTVK